MTNVPVQLKAAKNAPIYSIDVNELELAVELQRAAIVRVGGTAFQCAHQPSRRLFPFQSAMPLEDIRRAFQLNSTMHKIELLTDGEFTVDGVHAPKRRQIDLHE